MTKFYDCYSYNLMKFLSSNFFVPVKISKHYRTHRTIWVFEKTPELDALLKEWSSKKK